jgi:hypothetical protein
MARIAENWMAAVGPEALTLVTVPPPGSAPGLLWERFCEAATIPAADYVDVRPANTSLDAASAVLLRDLNEALAPDGLGPGEYHTLVKFGLAKRVLAGRSGAPAIGFTPPAWLVERSAQIADRLAASGARIVGDLAELAPVTVPGVDPDGVPAPERLAAAVHALRGVTVQRAASRHRRAAGRSRGPDRP